MPRNERRHQRFKTDERVDTMGTNIYSSKDNQSLHKSLNGEFILYQILIEHLLDQSKQLSDHPSSISEYFQPDNPIDKDLMEEFDTKYKSSEAIHWYTRETPIYKLLNKALRTQDIDDVNAFSQFVRDLNQQLKGEQKIFSKAQKSSILTVYRGQFISIDEINRLKSSQGQLISMNSFLSTSTNKEKAVEFATSRSPPNDQLTSILLEIYVNIKSPSRPLADIKHLSAFSEEEEILFMFGCVFRIDDLSFDQQIQIWKAKLTLCGEGDSDMKEFLSSLDLELNQKNKFISLGNYFIQMQKYQEAEQHYQNILEDNLINQPIEFAYCYYGLAQVNEKKGEYQLAIQNLHIVLDYLFKDSSTNDHSLISQSYNDLGSMYNKERNYLLSMQFYEKALKTTNNNSSTTYFGLAQIQFDLGNFNFALEYLQKSLDKQSAADHSSIANIYIHMGKAYSQMNQKEKATEMFDKAIESQLKNLSPQHPDLSYTYIAQGLMYSDINDEQKAFEYIEKAYQLQLQSLPNNHSDFAQTYLHFGNLYMKKGDLDEALSYYHKSLENQLKTLLWNHSSVAETYLTIGNVHWKKKDYDQALIYFHKVLDSELERKEFGDPSLTNAFKHLGDLYFEKGDMDQALVFYLQNLDNELERKFYEDISLADTYKIIANIYYKKRLLSHSLLYSNRLLDCYLRKQPLDEKSLAEVYVMIGKVYLKKVEFNDTLLYYEKSQINLSNEKTLSETSSDEKLSNKKSLKTEYQNIGNIHFEKRHLDEALNYFKKYLKQQGKFSPKSDPSFSDTYQILGNIYFEKRNFDKALNCYLKLLNNKLLKKQVDDSSLSKIYKAIGSVYLEKNILNEALTYFNRLIDCRLKKKKSFENSSVIEGYQLVAKVYLAKHYFNQTSNYLNKFIQNEIETRLFNNTTATLKQSNFTDFQFEKRHLDSGLVYFQKLLNQQIKNPSLKLFSFEDLYTIIGNMFLEKQDFHRSLIYFQQLISYQLRQNSQGDFFSLNTYAVIANIYLQQGDFNQALLNYRLSLKICQTINPTNQLLIQNLKHKIREILFPNI